MSDFHIEWNPHFERDLAKDVVPAIGEIAAERTRQCDDLIAVRRGGSLEDVKTEIVQIYENAGGSITDPELTQHAEMIVAGQRLVFEPGQ